MGLQLHVGFSPLVPRPPAFCSLHYRCRDDRLPKVCLLWIASHPKANHTRPLLVRSCPSAVDCYLSEHFMQTSLVARSGKLRCHRGALWRQLLTGIFPEPRHSTIPQPTSLTRQWDIAKQDSASQPEIPSHGKAYTDTATDLGSTPYTDLINTGKHLWLSPLPRALPFATLFTAHVLTALATSGLYCPIGFVAQTIQASTFGSDCDL